VTTTCLLADDHAALRAAVSSFLEAEGYEVVAVVPDGRSAVRAVAESVPDVAVVDYRMPHPSGELLLRELRAASPATRIVVYTADGDEALAREALGAGASAVVLKEAPLADLARALEAVLAGGTYLDPGLAQRVDARPRLTDRERDVLQLIAHGRSHDDIAGALGIGSETVRTHLRKACDRLGAASRTQAVATALRLGLIS